jgi:hypothetical protein
MVENRLGRQPVVVRERTLETICYLSQGGDGPIGTAQGRIGIDGADTRSVQLEVEVWGAWLGVAGITHPTDHFAGQDPGPGDDVGSDPDTAPVIGPGAIVVEVDVPR